MKTPSVGPGSQNTGLPNIKADSVADEDAQFDGRSVTTNDLADDPLPVFNQTENTGEHSKSTISGEFVSERTIANIEENSQPDSSDTDEYIKIKARLRKPELIQYEMPVYEACKSGNLDDLKVLLSTEKGQKELLRKCESGITPLHMAACVSHKCLGYILENKMGLAALSERDDFGCTPLYYSMQFNEGSLEKSKSIIDLVPETLNIRNEHNVTAFELLIWHFITFHKDPSRQQWASEFKALILSVLELDAIAEKLSRVDFYLYTTVPGDPEIDEKITKIRDRYAPAFKVIPFCKEKMNDKDDGSLINTGTDAERHSELDLASRNFHQKEINKSNPSIEALNLNTFDSSHTEKLTTKAKRIISGLESIGVYGRFSCYQGETMDSIFSLGDENTTIQLIQSLTQLGVSEIVCRMTPPVDYVTSRETLHNRKDQIEAMDSDTRKAYEQEQKRKEKVTYKKISMLLREFDPEQGVPQTVTMNGCKVRFIAFDDKDTLSPVEFGFSEPNARYFDTGFFPENYVHIFPYRYRSHSQAIYTNTDGKKAARIPLELPANSSLPEFNETMVTNAGRPFSESLPFKEALMKHYSLDSMVADNIAEAYALTQSGEISSSVVYGLHHKALLSAKKRIANCWINALEERASNKNTGKPVIIYMNRQNLPDDISHLTVIDATSDQSIDALHKLKENGGVAVFLLPHLPKPRAYA